MPKKKGPKKHVSQDFTINDCANAPKPVSRVKKSAPVEPKPSELSWDQIETDDYDIIEEASADGTKTLVYKKKKNNSKSEDNIDDRPGIDYPEIVWYLISQYVKPEDVGNFAGINSVTYAITQRESFWNTLYRRHCLNHPKLPARLRIENSYKLYGLRQRVIRALYHTYDVFVQRTIKEAAQDSKLHQLVKRRCVNVWFCQKLTYWSIYFKFKKFQPIQTIENNTDFIQELGRIDANPEKDVQVLKVQCRNFNEVPPLMGTILSSVRVTLCHGFRQHRLHLGFNTGHHNVSRNILPEYTVAIDTVGKMLVLDWWHPKYPHFENRLPQNVDGDSRPVLKEDFFTMREGELY